MFVYLCGALWAIKQVYDLYNGGADRRFVGNKFLVRAKFPKSSLKIYQIFIEDNCIVKSKRGLRQVNLVKPNTLVDKIKYLQTIKVNIIMIIARGGLKVLTTSGSADFNH